ncbi:hypothetical protein A8990_11023 [Paenibacillus taihuensis]|uniref:Uncharacterized protein n=1 Tax=Paenibacillus taihuensis TaxID=1156355 RepID=A0A3D9S321_9BACL|nr:hypothetical protein [Paenibacillus taihuensis]REE86415.1 hypothetical protein A8990_11023 [Paenibacillus taihuensis]
MKKTLLIAAMSAFVVVSFTILIRASTERVPERTENDDGPGAFAQGSFSDGVLDIKDLKRSADLIVFGAAVSEQASSDVGVATTFKVTKSFKGKSPEEIIIYQLKDGNELVSGEGYYLFLRKQTDDQENTYYISGGIQGLFDKKDQKVSAREHLMRSSMKELIKGKAAGTSDVEFFEGWINQ